MWLTFCQYVNGYNYKKTKWGAPIKAGFNNSGFDDIIVDRICGGNTIDFCSDKKEPYKFGPWDKDYRTEGLFHPIHNVDLMRMMWTWTENRVDIKSVSMDTMRDWLGMDKSKAHDALFDCQQGAELLIRMLKMQRYMSTKVKFDGAFKENKNVKT